MAENMKIDRVVDENGRRVETRTYETVVNGQKQRVTETHVEEIPMALHERVVESIAPVVTTRTKEVYKDGKVVDSLTEELDHGGMKMGVVRQGNALTKEDLKEVISTILDSQPKTVREAPKPKVLKTTEATKNPLDDPKILEWLEIGCYVILSGQLAFCVYHLVLKNWI